MKHHLISAIVLTIASVVGVRGDSASSISDRLVVHEWGTFTSIASEYGNSVDWIPQSDPGDLPCFVEQLRHGLKAGLMGRVRMETPVIYFYAQRDVDVKVSVGFQHGVLTEWYPKAIATPSVVTSNVFQNQGINSTLEWPSVSVRQKPASGFPADRRSSHYYLARQTDASPVTVGAQSEKFLFYRGVGRFAAPLMAIATGNGSVIVKSPTGNVGDVMVFANHGGRRSFTVVRGGGRQVTLSPAPEGEGVPAEEELRDMLVAHGLFAKEADAMIATWRDSWFEQGTRVFYMVQRTTIDAILPLRIVPQPEAVERVFVGRIELVTPATEREVREAIGRSDYALLERYGRFLDPIVSRILRRASDADRASLRQGLRNFSMSRATVANTCN